MDRDRYKRSRHNVPQKRSINSEEKPLRSMPVTFISPQTAPRVAEPAEQEPQSLVSQQPYTPPVQRHNVPVPPKITQMPEKPLLFDDEDEDIFGVWKTQKEIKRARKAEEAAKKQAKKQAKLAAKAQKQSRKDTGAPREIAVTLKVPRVKKIKQAVLKRYNPDHKKIYIVGGVLMLLPLLAIGTGTLLQATKQTDKKTEVLGQKTVAAKPDFSTIKPTTTDNQATELRYDTEKKLASYNDVLDNVAITVSQQPLPASFKDSPTTSVENLAKQMNANDKISTSDTTAFAGISIKGPQTVVFTKNDLLIFIIADKKIDTLKWSKYIESMQS